jgi:hypothetical protein
MIINARYGTRARRRGTDCSQTRLTDGEALGKRIDGQAHEP